MRIHALLFSKVYFTKTQAETWLVERHRWLDDLWETPNTYRYVQNDVVAGGRYFTTRVCDGVQVVMQDTD